ncbi:MAG TPA: hypothetical protein DDW85_02380 [Porphyromonadaceae bacterium]|nr:hypothetical protein [Porphyromonadaceae bacterium]
MAAKKALPDLIERQKELQKRVEKYASNVRGIYFRYMNRLVNLVKDTELIEDAPFSFKEYGHGDEATAILREMYSTLYQEVRGDISNEWLLSNTHNDDLVKSVFGAASIQDNHFARYFNHNKEAMDTFFARKTQAEGLNLSQRVWKYTGHFREELENILDLAIGEGTGANKLAPKVQGYLQDPDKFYRRFRVKTGEKNGESEYGRIWKRRIFDKESNSFKWIDDNPKKYNPGRGIYRSSFKNAQRLVRTETNMAYRAADFERFQQLDFVTGYEIRRSNNPYPCDMCQSLVGIYPKDFKWTGWHPNCRCYMIPVLASPDEMQEMIEVILSGGDPSAVKLKGEVRAMPSEFVGWIQKNKVRMKAAKNRGVVPYFVKDNQKRVGEVIK